MSLLGLDLQPRVIEDVRIMGTHEDTYNISVADFHTFFVGETGLLVHNSAFENTTKTFTEIYGIRGPSGKIVYVGKTIQGIDARFEQHIATAHPQWAKGYKPKFLGKGDWTTYEAAVWEQHFIDVYGGISVLENRQLAITERKYNKFKTLHDPC
jgi:hypothetical protein